MWDLAKASFSELSAVALHLNCLLYAIRARRLWLRAEAQEPKTPLQERKVQEYKEMFVRISAKLPVELTGWDLTSLPLEGLLGLEEQFGNMYDYVLFRQSMSDPKRSKLGKLRRKAERQRCLALYKRLPPELQWGHLEEKVQD